MLVECGVGAWHLALLHLVAHSLYKAHAFLASGSVVHHSSAAAMARIPRRPRVRDLSVAIVIAIAPAAIARGLGLETGTVVALGMVSLACLPSLALGTTAGGAVGSGIILRCAALIAAYFAQRAVLAPLVTVAAPPFVLGYAVVLAGFVGLLVLRLALEMRPESDALQKIHRWLFAGLYLDEVFTRLTFILWPLRPRPALVAALVVTLSKREA